MNCPDCGHEQTCPCKACQERIPTEKPWIWIDEQFIKCAGCGRVESEDWWATLEFDQYEKERMVGYSSLE
jgi:hypothetical protein